MSLLSIITTPITRVEALKLADTEIVFGCIALLYSGLIQDSGAVVRMTGLSLIADGLGGWSILYKNKNHFAPNTIQQDTKSDLNHVEAQNLTCVTCSVAPPKQQGKKEAPPPTTLQEEIRTQIDTREVIAGATREESITALPIQPPGDTRLALVQCTFSVYDQVTEACISAYRSASIYIRQLISAASSSQVRPESQILKATVPQIVTQMCDRSSGIDYVKRQALSKHDLETIISDKILAFLEPSTQNVLKPAVDKSI